MKNTLFTEEQIALLNKNPFVRSVTHHSIQYTDAFKWHFISQRLKGKNPSTIFEEAGFPQEILASTHLDAMTRQWPTALPLPSHLPKFHLRSWFSFAPKQRKKPLVLVKKSPIA
ncbi:hypothetical protein ABB02_00061 [Clostridiaceae bacterium JG1575]|nr:hypothetical protein ABB02_00061 [Clostridiaceae bacterium JG1575]